MVLNNQQTLIKQYSIVCCVIFFLGVVCQSVVQANQEKPNDDFRKKLKAALSVEHAFEDKYEAQVWLKAMSLRLAKRAPHIPEKERFEILRLAHREAKRYKLDPQIVLALIEVESNFDRYAISKAGALGLMQIMPFWKDEIGKPGDNLMTIETNLRYGCAILSLYLEKEKNNMTRALARYNGSLGKTWYPQRVFSALKKRWRT